MQNIKYQDPRFHHDQRQNPTIKMQIFLLRLISQKLYQLVVGNLRRGWLQNRMEKRDR